MTRLVLTVERMPQPTALHTTRPRFTWIPDTAHERQDGYEIEVRDAAGKVLWSTGLVASQESSLVEYDGKPLRSDSDYRARVRAWYPDASSDWAECAFGTSLLDAGEWVHPWIEPTQPDVTEDGAHRFHEMFTYVSDTPPDARLHPPRRIRQRITVPSAVTRARLYATAQGVYTAWINGRRVGEEELAPGNDSYRSHISFQGYDVTELLTPGDNIVAFEVADGWFAGRVGMLGASAEFGHRLRLRWQLSVEDALGDRRRYGSSADAVTSDGPIRYSDLAIGEKYDARMKQPDWNRVGFDDSHWDNVRTVDVDAALVPFVGEPVRRLRELAAREVLTTPSGDTVIDFGQVIAGRVRMRVRGTPGDVITLEHTEVLDEAGEFFDNIHGPNKDQRDVYIVGSEEVEEWEPQYTFHGFRYARVHGVRTVRAADFTAVVIGSALPETASLSTSDARLNRLFENVQWSQRGNFLSIPTDCPQRERLGWTGDAQLFAPTAATLMMVGNFFDRWLTNVRADQRTDGAVPNIIPWPPVFDYFFEEPPPSYDDDIMVLSTSAAWGDAIVTVPWAMYRHYGDLRVLGDNYHAMRRWHEFQSRQAADILPPRLRGVTLSDAQRDRQRLLWNGTPNFGDWLVPSTLSSDDPRQMMEAPRQTGELVGAMYHGHVTELLGAIAEILGDAETAWIYRARVAEIREAFAAEYLTADGRLPTELQGVAALALQLGFIPERHRRTVAERLANAVRTGGNRLDAGFVSIPVYLDALSENGHLDVARDVLHQDSFPSWLYEIDRGATTIWETWGAIRPDGTVEHASLNHYAYGCVADWMMRHVGGITMTSPAFRTVRIAPDIEGPVSHVEARIETPYGQVTCAWARVGSRIEIEVVLPTGVTGTLALPPGWSAMTEGTSGSRPEGAGLPVHPGATRVILLRDGA
ncbi:family 78 glycoside hydrolase catalytic domain [Microbacterium sp.]|uniref:alpha-L-rhamnosidase n=1 Tax=Microbacterium sp. TaxID=51671 RepID=UPI003F72D378